MNTTTGIFTAPVSGYYRVSSRSLKSTSDASINLYKNNAFYGTLFAFAIATGFSSGTIGLKLIAGETLDLRCDGSVTLDAIYFEVEKVGNAA